MSASRARADVALLDGIPEEESRLARPEPMPSSVKPMLATLTAGPFSDPRWIFERKLDGVRCLAFHDGRRACLRSRTARDVSASYPELVEALAPAGAGSFVADGEIVAFDGEATSFERLQGRMHIADPDRARRSGIPVYLYLFDLIHADGLDLTALPLRRRKALLRRAVRADGPVSFSPHRNERGIELYEEACRRGWEGLIAKRADSPYVHTRSRDWLKVKCSRRQEFVIGGFTDPTGSRTAFGALLVGYYGDGELRYAGKVGTGYTEQTLRELGATLRRFEVPESPFRGPPPLRRGAHWVKPRLVAEVAFTEWTRDGRLRHPRFLGLRDDKHPEEVVRERAV